MSCRLFGVSIAVASCFAVLARAQPPHSTQFATELDSLLTARSLDAPTRSMCCTRRNKTNVVRRPTGETQTDEEGVRDGVRDRGSHVKSFADRSDQSTEANRHTIATWPGRRRILMRRVPSIRVSARSTTHCRTGRTSRSRAGIVSARSALRRTNPRDRIRYRLVSRCARGDSRRIGTRIRHRSRAWE